MCPEDLLRPRSASKRKGEKDIDRKVSFLHYKTWKYGGRRHGVSGKEKYIYLIKEVIFLPSPKYSYR